MPTVDDRGDGRLDHCFSGKVTAFLRYSHREYNQIDNPIIPLPLGANNSHGNVHIVNKQGAGGLTYTLGPTSLLEFRMGITNTIGGKWPLQLGLPDMQKRIRAGDGDRIAVLMTSVHKIVCTTSPKPATSYEAGADFRQIPPGTEQPRRGSTQRVSGAKRPGSGHNSGGSLSYLARQALAPETEKL